MPPYGIAQFYDEVYNDDPFNINRRDSEIIIGADGKAKTIPILPMTSDEIMSGSVIPPDFDAERFQSIFPNNVQTGIMTQAPLGFDTSFRVANEPDEEQVEFLGDRPNKFKEGLAKLFELFQRFSPIAAIGRGIDSLRNRIDTRRAIKEDIIKDSQGDINIVDLTGGDRGTTTAPQSGMQAERTRTRDLQSMRGGVGR